MVHVCIITSFFGIPLNLKQLTSLFWLHDNDDIHITESTCHVWGPEAGQKDRSTWSQHSACHPL